jgi:hypothetical protein
MHFDARKHPFPHNRHWSCTAMLCQTSAKRQKNYSSSALDGATRPPWAATRPLGHQKPIFLAPVLYFTI